MRPYEALRKVLHYSCSLSRFHLEAYLSYYSLCSPYIAYSALENELLEGEVGVYLGHLMAGLRFSIDPDLLEILKYYDLPLCRYSLASIGCMVGLLSLFPQKRFSFSINLFSYLFRVWGLGCDGFGSVGACQKKS